MAAALAADHIARRRDDPVSSKVDRTSLAERIAAFDFKQPMSSESAARALMGLLSDTGVRTDHPRYYGFFNPPALVPGIVGDIIADAVNPQLAVWSHAPAAVDIERHVVNLFGGLIWQDEDAAGTFTSGGSEANHTALLCALVRRYPEWSEKGVRAIARAASDLRLGGIASGMDQDCAGRRSRLGSGSARPDRRRSQPRRPNARPRHIRTS